MNTAFPPGATLELNGMQLYYALYGQGAPLLLLHGYMGAGSDWEPFLPELAQEYLLVIPDLRGHGRSTNPLPEFTHRQAALDVVALLDHLGVKRCRALGVSGGGNLLLHLATKQPDRVEAMALVSSTSYFPQQARAFMDHYSLDALPNEEQRRMWQRHPRGDEQIQALVRQGRAMKDSHEDMNFTPAYLSTITARTLIVSGDRDPLYPVEIALELYQAIPRSYLWVIPNGGHVPLSKEQPFLKIAVAFLRGDWERAEPV